MGVLGGGKIFYNHINQCPPDMKKVFTVLKNNS